MNIIKNCASVTSSLGRERGREREKCKGRKRRKIHRRERETEGREGGRDGGREGGRDGGREGGRVRWREGGRERWREGGRERWREGGREGEREGITYCEYIHTCIHTYVRKYLISQALEHCHTCSDVRTYVHADAMVKS